VLFITLDIPPSRSVVNWVDDS